jgi:2,3-bisphosphoglycerate-dependent phosphoglycerate mutase
MKYFILVIFAILFNLQAVNAQKAITIFVVRHAEKDVTDVKQKDPGLSIQGVERAVDLMKYLSGSKLDSVYCTSYKRAVSTALPTAKKKGLILNIYNSEEQDALAKQLIARAQGKNILIVGHSNTVLNMVQAFGVKKPIGELTDDDYDYIFKITIVGTKAEVKVSHYGKIHNRINRTPTH